ncbi:unnamed protein product [Paramecium sonneborni]|uniref:Uncharacterized protein n=1 Tax=Paramecium sonneborni TaxID=65129 RepID=A0A8S1R144_9CILI|nr:unnamed protein product [Paramecium sonneborni]
MSNQGFENALFQYNYSIKKNNNQQINSSKRFSSILFKQLLIHNYNHPQYISIILIEVIIISIDQNSSPIPISLIQVNFKIKQINLINYSLILSYLCNNDQNMCFQVWNVQNLPKYNYIKNLYSENIDKKVIIQSDNLFLYVTFSNYTVYVYNPSLPYHLSLYYKLELTSPIQFSVQLSLNNPNSIIFSNNNFYILFESQQFNLIINIQIKTLTIQKVIPYILIIIPQNQH